MASVDYYVAHISPWVILLFPFLHPLSSGFSVGDLRLYELASKPQAMDKVSKNRNLYKFFDNQSHP